MNRFLANLVFLVAFGACGGAGTNPDGPHDGGMVDGAVAAVVACGCDNDGTCDEGETCASCSADCGSCDVADIAGLRAKYVDPACTNHGDGLADTCAASEGAAGRFNDLQLALDTMAAGEILYLHPGDYWHDEVTRDSGALYTIAAVGTAESPIVITSANRGSPATIHSCDPDNPTYCPSPALGVYGAHTIVDHLRVRGRIQLWGGTRLVAQHLTCTHGWGACGDGNWSCIRIEGCTDCSARYNEVHSVSGAGMGEACINGMTSTTRDRGAGLKEFSSDGTIWEFNTVRDAPVWSYDLHRNSIRTTIRFNRFEFMGDAMRMERTQYLTACGNVLATAQPSGFGRCATMLGRNEALPPDAPHLVDFHHNTCIAAQDGFVVSADLPAVVENNIFQSLRQDSEPPKNVAVANPLSSLDHNAYDANAEFRRELYTPPYFFTLADWQTATGQDPNSQAAPGGVCTLDADFRPTDVTCSTLSDSGGQVGAYGITDCVGHLCR